MTLGGAGGAPDAIGNLSDRSIVNPDYSRVVAPDAVATNLNAQQMKLDRLKSAVDYSGQNGATISTTDNAKVAYQELPDNVESAAAQGGIKGTKTSGVAPQGLDFLI